MRLIQGGDGGYSLAGFVRFCAELRTETGEPLRVEPFQREMLRPHFGGATETLIVIPKGNGKTTLLSALALYHLENVDRAKVIVVATTREQARTLFDQAAQMVDLAGMEHTTKNPGRFVVKSGYGKIWLPGGNSSSARIEVRAADAGRIDGAIPTLVLVDELHEHKSLDLYTRMKGGLVKRPGASMLTISTAGGSMASPLWAVREGFMALPSFRRNHQSKRAYAESESGKQVMYEWSLGNEDDADDMRVVKKANPASWLTPVALGDIRFSPTTPGKTQVSWRRLHCGIWNEGEEPWLEPEKWDALAGEPVLEAGDQVFVGLHLGYKGQEAAIVTVAPKGGDYLVEAQFLPNDRLLRVEEELEYLRGMYDVQYFVYGSSNFDRSAEVLADQGFPIESFPLTPSRMTPASGNLLRLIEEGRLVHNGDGVLRSHVLAGTARDYERGWTLVQNPQTRRPVSGLMALTIAIDYAQGDRVSPFVEVI